jgi:hypothetical protein
MAQQTAVEWLIDKLEHYHNGHSEYFSYTAIHNRALRMEKEQMIKAYINGDLMEGRANLSDAEQYYNETYNK